MLNAKAFAHAATLVTAAFYIVCWLISALDPNFVFEIAKSWFHSVSLEILKSAKPMSLESGFIGLVTISVLTWVTTYATIWLYNKWAKK